MKPGNTVTSQFVRNLCGKILKTLPDSAHAVVQCGRKQIVTNLKY